MINNLIKYIARLATNNKIDNPIATDILDNDVFLYLLEYHQILPYLHYFKKTLQKKFPLINEDVFLKSQVQWMKNLCKTMVYSDFLSKSNPPEYFMVKGFVAATEFYKPEALRSFNDMDIFIASKNLDKWMKFLEAHNFEKYGNLSDDFPLEIIKKYNFAQHFVCREKNIAIDLHLNISNKMHPFQFDMEDFFSHSKQIVTNGIKINTFQTEYQILYLLYHSFKHYYFKLLWFIDLYKVFALADYDEHILFLLIKKYKLTKLLNFYIDISTEIFGNSGIKKDSVFFQHYKSKKNKFINSQNVIKGEFPLKNSVNRLFLPMYFLTDIRDKYKYLKLQFFPPMEIIPEFYSKKKEKNFWNYAKYRLDRLKRI